MFAVPAFASLSSASLKSSFGKAPGKPSSLSTPAGLNDTIASSKSRKRKRSQPAETDAVTDISLENIGELWSKVVEGKGSCSRKANGDSTVSSSAKEAEGKKSSKDKKKKKRKHDDEESALKKEIHHENERSETVSNGESGLIKQSTDPQSSISGVADARISINSKRNDDNETGRRDEKTKHKKDKKQNKKERQTQDEDPFTAALSAAGDPDPTVDVPVKAPTLTPLQEKMRQKLSGARFRHLNQLLYTTPSQDSLSLFKSQPEMFRDYHSGFRQQVESWPENPVDIYIRRLFARGKLRDSGFRGGKNRANGISSVNANPLGVKGFQDTMDSYPLPRAKDGYASVIDLGCGEAALAKAITSAKPRPKIKVNSYDLHAPNPLVTVADIANLPLPNGSVDIAIFCLALMGTNWPTMIEEAIRVLRNGGEIWIAEIKSRFARTKTGQKEEPKEQKKGKGKKNAAKDMKDNTNPVEAFVEEQDDNQDQNRWAAGEQDFVDALARRGLRLKNRNGSNKMFVLLDFEKAGGRGGQMFQIPPKPDMHGRISKKFHTNDEPEVEEAKILQPCFYKIR
ncbi:25S rRNA (adenine645-N1)-methyltransferase [Orbilia oligospora]|uniref:Ribosomal RNA-processing protein 8 n=1 Tax=Orbilia oligospora TaxID=2813651 RepID=A0A7C8NGX4_ORBOL|nr:25S rRNA (adenine645-N1)-methyltransferase [Orbilia oligospora]KAF3106496.1 25S rRNA (adenine645-N1)-methyltransferase [Orbilia oligospora]KAF3106595.1 25S rRNA (adenine645-N1)-methyltransferase [Orbilia oligospora]KAF3130744.1 25S rRNA (adenine645-N1)-methyltransferase [Orbilia oligospora]KAF3140686.1 25S rRNA (adenine645-N1)-methyltransferase [Orbilia oligospora]